MPDLRGAFIIKTDSDTAGVGVELGGRAIYSYQIDGTPGTTIHEQRRLVRDVEVQMENWRICGVPRCILIHNGRKVGELLAAA